jgi:hypothetical protein
MYLSKSSLQNFYNQKLDQKSYQDYLKKNVADPDKKRIFLSHSHIDVKTLSNDEIKALIIFLLEYFNDVYIDWLDPEMPDKPCEETAIRLQEKIEFCDRFLLVATNNAVNSRWVPWELGYGDKAKEVPNISVIPIADPNGQWEGAEYLRLYPHLKLINDKPWIYAPSGSLGYSLGYWGDTGKL